MWDYYNQSNIRQDISFNNSSSLSASLKSDYVSVVVNSVNMDFYSVWADEFNNVDYSLNSDKCLIAFDYTIEIKVDKDLLYLLKWPYPRFVLD